MGSFPETYNNPHEVGLGVWLLPSGLDASPLIIKGLPSSSMSPVPIYTRVRDRRARHEPQTSRSGVRGVNRSATHVFSLKQTVNSTLGENE